MVQYSERLVTFLPQPFPASFYHLLPINREPATAVRLPNPSDRPRAPRRAALAVEPSAAAPFRRPRSFSRLRGAARPAAGDSRPARWPCPLGPLAPGPQRLPPPVPTRPGQGSSQTGSPAPPGVARWRGGQCRATCTAFKTPGSVTPSIILGYTLISVTW